MSVTASWPDAQASPRKKSESPGDPRELPTIYQEHDKLYDPPPRQRQEDGCPPELPQS